MSNEVHSPDSSSGSAVTTKVCPSCGTEYSFDVLFCPRDGGSLIPKSTCSGLVGQIIAERYHILRKLGEGGMGRVYLAEHVTMGRMCAIKVIHPSLRSDAEAVGRFRREAANAGRINHPHVAAIYDCGETNDGLVYLAMEYVPGDSLSTLLKWNSALLPRRAVSIALQVSDALGAAHRLGIIHRDLKPDNIIVARSKDGNDLAKVVDFGIAKATQGGSQTVTRAGFVVGTIQYMSPEQMIGDPIDVRSDLYSLGCILYEMLVGKRLFEGTTGELLITQRLTQAPPRARQLNPDIPKALDDIVAKMLSRSPADRYQNAEAIVAQLQEIAPVLKQGNSSGWSLITPWRNRPAAPTESPVQTQPAAETPVQTVPAGDEASAQPSEPVAQAIVAAPAAAAQPVEQPAPLVDPLPITRTDRRPSDGIESPAVDEGGKASMLGRIGLAAAAVGAIAIGAMLLRPSGAATEQAGVLQDALPASATPTLAAVVPAELTADNPPAEIALRGSGFLPGAVVRWNGVERPATLSGDSLLLLGLDARDMDDAGAVTIAVVNPGPTESAPFSLQIIAPPPAPVVLTDVVVRELELAIAEERARAENGDFSRGLGSFRALGQRIAALQQENPASEKLRELEAEHSDAYFVARQLCEEVGRAARTNGQTPVRCN
jgi:serine/threonine protein kinase